MSTKSGNIILGTLIGTAVGFAAGILLAPASGKETREQIGDKASDAKDAINDLATKAMASLKEVRESVEQSLKNDSKLAIKEASKLKEEAKNQINKA